MKVLTILAKDNNIKYFVKDEKGERVFTTKRDIERLSRIVRKERESAIAEIKKQQLRAVFQSKRREIENKNNGKVVAVDIK